MVDTMGLKGAPSHPCVSLGGHTSEEGMSIRGGG